MNRLMSRFRFLLLAIGLAGTMLVNSPTVIPAVAEPILVQDADGKEVAIDSSSRIVSIGGAVTEILYALGLGDRIVGVDTTSLFPPNALSEKPNVGYMRQLSPEGVLGLNPRLILAIQGSGPKEALDVLKAAGVPYLSVPESYSEIGIIEKIKRIARAVDADARGACLAAAVASDLAELKKLRDGIGRPVRVMFVMSLLNGRAMVAGHNTAANEIIKLAGGVNAVEGFDGYKPVSDEAIVAAKPDVILSMQRGKDSLDPEALFATPSFALTPAAARKSFVSMDGLYLLGFGPRTAAAARDLAMSLYPDIARTAAAWKPAALTVDCHK